MAVAMMVMNLTICHCVRDANPRGTTATVHPTLASDKHTRARSTSRAWCQSPARGQVHIVDIVVANIYNVARTARKRRSAICGRRPLRAFGSARTAQGPSRTSKSTTDGQLYKSRKRNYAKRALAPWMPYNLHDAQWDAPKAFAAEVQEVSCRDQLR